MEFKITNNTPKAKVVTVVDNQEMKKITIAPTEHVVIANPKDLSELECNGTIFLLPTFIENKQVELLDDKEVKRSKFQLIFALIILTAAIAIFSYVTLTTDLKMKIALIAVEVGTAVLVWVLLSKELKADVVIREC